MNQITNQFSIDPAPTRGDGWSGVAAFDFDALLAAVKRQRWVVATFALVCLVLATAYAFTTTPLFTAATQVLLDTGKVRALKDVEAVVEGTLDTAAIDSQIEILRSPKIAADVVRRLNLDDDPEFVSRPGAVRRTINWVLGRGGDAALEKASREQIAIGAFMRNMSARRVARTYLLDLNFTSEIPEKSTRVVNALANAFLNDQLDARFDATRRASGWLQERIEDLRQRAVDADTAVQNFRTANGLVTASGKLVNEQQLSELNTQLTNQRAEVGRMEARSNRIRSIVESRNSEAAVAESIDNPIISRLRNLYLDASRNEADLVRRLGENHQSVVNLRNEMKQYERLMFEELGRLAESYRSDLQIARSREQALSENLKTVVGANAADNTTLVTLRELERASETYRTLYQAFLQRYQEALQQQSFPITDARVITPAAVPQAASWPRKSLLMLAGLLGGAALGSVVGFVREFKDRAFRTGNQVRDELDLEMLGFLPLIPDAGRPTAASPAADGAARPAAGGRRSVLRYAVEEPLSAFAETLRAVKVASDIRLVDRPTKVIGVVSILPSEGKSTTSKNLASLIAHLGNRTILIDGDLRNPGLSRAMGQGRSIGLSDILTDHSNVQDTIVTEAETGLDFIPIGSKRQLSHTSEMLSSSRMRGLLERLGQAQYQYIVVDLPPLGPVVDVRAAATLFDAFLLVCEWGKTPRAVVRGALEQDRAIKDRCLGAVLNKVDVSRINLYEGLDSKAYYYGQYRDYYLASS